MSTSTLQGRGINGTLNSQTCEIRNAKNVRTRLGDLKSLQYIDEISSKCLLPTYLAVPMRRHFALWLVNICRQERVLYCEHETSQESGRSDRFLVCR